VELFATDVFSSSSRQPFLVHFLFSGAIYPFETTHHPVGFSFASSGRKGFSAFSTTICMGDPSFTLSEGTFVAGKFFVHK
jgi:hypothetical protein